MTARILVAPDSFKGTFSASEVAEAIGRGVTTGGADPVLCPAADGGEGTVETLVAGVGGEFRSAAVLDPLGREIEARFALLRAAPSLPGPEPVAAVEVAEASGLVRIAEDERDAEAAGTIGTGQLIAAAVAAGARRVLVAAGGSASTDGGRGAITAIEAAGGIGDIRLEVLCDTRVPFERAAEVFSPQKGADPEAVARLADRLQAYAGALPRDPRGTAMSGAAGGLAGGLWAAFGARLVPGAAFVLGLLGFDQRLGAADAAITGEGRLDAQTLEGKLVGEIARRCRREGIPVHAIVGESALDPEQVRALGIASLETAGRKTAIAQAAARITASAIA